MVDTGEGYMLPEGRDDGGARLLCGLLGRVVPERPCLYIGCVPERDGGADEVETADAVHLVLVGAVAHLAEAVEEDCSGKGVAGLVLVEVGRDLAP